MRLIVAIKLSETIQNDTKRYQTLPRTIRFPGKDLESDVAAIIEEISKKLSQTKEDRAKFIRSFIKPLKLELDNLGVKYEIKGRPKSIFSIYNKMKKQQVSFRSWVWFQVAAKATNSLEKYQSNTQLDKWVIYAIL